MHTCIFLFKLLVYCLLLFVLLIKITLNMGSNSCGTVSVHIHSITNSCSYLTVSLLLITIIGNTKSLNDNDDNNIILFLESQDEAVDLTKYRCKVTKSQIKHSNLVAYSIEDQLDQLQHGDIEVPLIYDAAKQFWNIGFNDTCDYFQSVIFYQDYKDYLLSMPLSLNNSNDFYNDVQ